jgi:hypothetical protein
MAIQGVLEVIIGNHKTEAVDCGISYATGFCWLFTGVELTVVADEEGVHGAF